MSITLMILLGLILLLAFAPKKDGTPSAASAFVAPLVPSALTSPGPVKSNRDVEDDQDIEALAEAYRAHQKGERAKAAIDKVATLAKKAS